MIFFQDKYNLEHKVIIEVDEENRRLFYEEQNKEKLNTKRNDDDKQAGNSNVVTQPADSFKKAVTVVAKCYNWHRYFIFFSHIYGNTSLRHLET